MTRFEWLTWSVQLANHKICDSSGEKAIKKHTRNGFYLNFLTRLRARARPVYCMVSKKEKLSIGKPRTIVSHSVHVWIYLYIIRNSLPVRRRCRVHQFYTYMRPMLALGRVYCSMAFNDPNSRTGDANGDCNCTRRTRNGTEHTWKKEKTKKIKR